MISDQGFKLHPEAARDITDIWEYIAEENPRAASRVREDILDTIRKLVPFPQQGHKRPDLTSRPLRFQTVGNYLIAYVPDEKPLSSLLYFMENGIPISLQPSSVAGSKSLLRPHRDTATLGNCGEALLSRVTPPKFRLKQTIGPLICADRR